MSSAFDYCKNFKEKEFACKCGCGVVKSVNERMLYALQYLRTLYGVPVDIKSGGRCQAFNDSLPGSIKNSNHIPNEYGLINAADFQINGHCDTLAKRKVIMVMLSRFPGFKYAYCNGAILRAGQSMQTYSAAWMGRSIHVSFK